jgi:hypothetical protein
LTADVGVSASATGEGRSALTTGSGVSALELGARRWLIGEASFAGTFNDMRGTAPETAYGHARGAKL